MLAVASAKWCGSATYVEERSDEVDTECRDGSGNESADRSTNERLRHFRRTQAFEQVRNVRKSLHCQVERTDQQVHRKDSVDPRGSLLNT